MKQFNINSDNFSNYFFSFETYDRARYLEDWKSYEHLHSFSEVFFVTDGKGIFHTKDEDIPIYKGMVILINPMTVHTEFSSTDDPLEYAVFSIKNFTFFKNNQESQKQLFIYDLSNDFEFLFDVIRVIEDE